MAKFHYDVIVLGESLASRIAAVLLAKAGRRVLSVQLPATAPTRPVWIPVNLHFERLLDLLGGRSCLVPAIPFQVLSNNVRLTLHGVNDLLDELRREFPNDSEKVKSLLTELENLGERLENMLWEGGELPLTGWKSRWRFLYKTRMKGLSRRRLYQPLAGRLQETLSPRTVQVLSTLFSGLSLCPIEELTVAEGALLWHSFGDNRGISMVALNTLLTRRLEQFQGETAQLSRPEAVSFTNNRIEELLLDDGRRCSANCFLIGSAAASALLPPSQGSGKVHPSAALCRYRIVDGAVSPLLTPIVLLGGEPTMRLTLSADSTARPSRIICQSISSALEFPSAHDHKRLSALFPFAALTLEPSTDQQRQADSAICRLKIFPGAIRSLMVGKNLFWCCGEQVLPSLDAIGETMVAVTIVNHLQRQKQF